MANSADGINDSSGNSDDKNQVSTYTLAFRPIMPDRELGPLDVHVSHLPPEMLSAISRYLNMTSRCRTAGVCAGWRSLAYHPSLWHDTKLTMHTLPANFEPVFQSMNLRNIVHVKISDRTVLVTAAQRMPNLTGLILARYPATETNLTSILLARMPNQIN